MAYLGKKFGFLIKIGDREQNDISLTEFVGLKDLPFNYKNETQKKRIEQIDCIWLFKDGTPIYAFEVEESTSIISALERFWALLQINSDLGNMKRIVIVAPISRKFKLKQELSESSFIGHPQFMEKKIKYIFKEKFENNYYQLINSPDLKLEDIDNLTSDPEI